MGGTYDADVAPTYSFRDGWVVPGEPARVHAVLVDLEHYALWWPQVVAVAKVTEDDARVLCRSTLPYTLDLWLHAERREADLLETSVTGDLRGTVRFRLSAAPDGTRLHLEQDVDVVGRLAGAASYLARPVLTWNHDRMMAGCVAGLRRVLQTGDHPALQRGPT